MLKKLFGASHASQLAPETKPRLSSWTDDGLLFARQMASHDRQLDCYLHQLEEEGYLTPLAEDALLAWEDLFRLLSDEAHQGSLNLLDLPPVFALTPKLISAGALSDPDFQVSIQGWSLNGDDFIPGGLDRSGALVRLRGREGLMPEASWRVLLAVREMLANQRTVPGERTNQLGWAKVRKLAKTAGAGMDGFLAKSIVLNPDKLKLALRKSLHGGVSVVEVEPCFEGQSDNWLSSFDAYQQVQDRYHVVENDGSVVHVILTSEVKSVLESVKRMPARRVAGDDALQLVRNPYSVLGTEAVQVLDPDEFVQEREKAGVFFYRFYLEPGFDEAGRIIHADLLLEALSEKPQESVRLHFAAAHEFRPFVLELQAKMAAGFACGFWQGYELELSDFREPDLEGFQRLLDRWQQEAMGRLYEDVFDMSNYGDRVLGIGPVEAPSSPYIRKEGGEQWLPPELLKDSGLDADLLNRWDTSSRSDFETFCERIESAKEVNEECVRIPKVELEVSISNAEKLRDAWAKKFKEPGSAGGGAGMQTGILIESGVESAAENGARVKPLAECSLPQLPASLRAEIKLHAHQLHGVAWLQNLFGQVSHKVSGCLLADDMGLGKTLQLLCFIAWHLERQAQSGLPVLIVAPVSLLDNWEREFLRFFHTHGMPVLKLYGSALSEVKLKREEIPASLKAQGIRNLLRPGWVGEAKIVLTTYDTLRDQELSLARQKWSIVVCDEAQKIKNPAALVTKAAKALQADFRVACTGTPVENSLTDLWCLFDFVQFGLLGALNDFGRTYRRPIECKTDADNSALDTLRALIEPQILRRMKEDVADLPSKHEAQDCRALGMSSMQDRLYRSELSKHAERAAILQKAGDRNIAVLGLLHSLKLVCAHPHALRPEGDLLDVSPKMRWLMSQLERIRTAGEKAILFTELRDIQRDLRLTIMDRFGLPDVPVVNGDTATSSARGPNRQGIIDQFQARQGFGVIILSTAAVGFGVNVQAANHVIHFTRSWNPAKEDQATDRAYRIGQTREVHVYYPTVVSAQFETFEYKLDVLLGKKRALASDMLNGAEDVDVMTLAAGAL